MAKSRRMSIVLKLSGQAMAGDGHALNSHAVEAVGLQIQQLVAAGYRVGVVVGGGNGYRGGEPWGTLGIPRASGDRIGMYSTGLNALALDLQLQHLDSALRTTIIAKRGFVRPLFRAWLPRLPVMGSSHDVLIVAGGTGKGGVSTDVAAPLLARDLGADRIVMSKFGTKGIYSHDPRANPAEAVLLPFITVDEALARDLRIMDREAMRLCEVFGITVNVVPADEPEAFTEVVLDGAQLGSVLAPRSAPSTSPVSEVA